MSYTSYTSTLYTCGHLHLNVWACLCVPTERFVVQGVLQSDFLTSLMNLWRTEPAHSCYVLSALFSCTVLCLHGSLLPATPLKVCVSLKHISSQPVTDNWQVFLCSALILFSKSNDINLKLLTLNLTLKPLSQPRFIVFALWGRPPSREHALIILNHAILVMLQLCLSIQKTHYPFLGRSC